MSAHDSFARRHIGPDAAEQRAMLETLGLESLDALIERAVPKAIRRARSLELPLPLSEPEALAALKEMAARNRVMRSFIGMGYANCHTPSVILRNVLENPAWYTAYTPYQPEISQGRLEALINFQTMVADLTAMDIANASMLDEPTAAAEAMALAARVTRSKSTRFFVDSQCHPQTIDVVRTRARTAGIDLVVGDPEAELARSECFGALLQYPGTLGDVRDLRETVAAAKKKGVVVAMACDLLSLALLVPPGELGADMAVGSAQRFGVPPGYGGPHAGFLATRDAHKRSMPGRLVGVTVDAAGGTASARARVLGLPQLRAQGGGHAVAHRDLALEGLALRLERRLEDQPVIAQARGATVQIQRLGLVGRDPQAALIERPQSDLRRPMILFGRAPIPVGRARVIGRGQPQTLLMDLADIGLGERIASARLGQ